MNEIAIYASETDGISDVDPTTPIELKEKVAILISDDHIHPDVDQTAPIERAMNEIAIYEPETDGISDVDPTTPIELKEKVAIFISDDHIHPHVDQTAPIESNERNSNLCTRNRCYIRC